MEMSIKIGPIKYEVIEIHGLSHRGKDLDGHILYNQCEIRIEQNMDEQAKRQVIWHEILHGILTHAGITNEKESAIDALAYGIMQVLQDNPTLAAGS